MLTYSSKGKTTPFVVFKRFVLLPTLILCAATLQWAKNTQEVHFQLNFSYICSLSRRIWPPLFTELLKKKKKKTAFLLQWRRFPNGVTFEKSVLHQRTDADSVLVDEIPLVLHFTNAPLVYQVSHLSDLLYLSLCDGVISEQANPTPLGSN